MNSQNQNVKTDVFPISDCVHYCKYFFFSELILRKQGIILLCFLHFLFHLEKRMKEEKGPRTLNNFGAKTESNQTVLLQQVIYAATDATLLDVVAFSAVSRSDYKPRGAAEALPGRL